MTPRRRTMTGIATAIVATAVAVGATGCTASEPERPAPTAASATALEKQVERLRAHLACDGDVSWADDPYFWDSMRGVDCTTPDGQPVFVRVYAHDDSAAQVLQDWKGTFGAHRALIRGSDWFVIGPEETIAPVSSAESVAAPSVRVPDAEPLTGPAEARTTCVRFLSGAAQDRVRAPERFRSELPKLDALYPGTETVLDEALTAEHLEALEQAPDTQLAARLGDLAGPFKRFCRDVPPESGAEPGQASPAA